MEFIRHDWNEQYPEAAEEILYDVPNSKQPVKSKRADITAYVDTGNNDLINGRSVSGILLSVNKTPVKWYSKRQNTVEMSSYGAELVAARIAVELVMEYRYKLRMLRFEINVPSTVLIDNLAVDMNTSLPSSTLKKTLPIGLS